MPPDVPVPETEVLLTGAELRTLLRRRLPGDREFLSFCQDHFPSVRRLFTGSMNLLERENLLLESVEPAELRAALAQHGPRLMELLSPGTARLPEQPSPSQLLQARYEVVPFYETGRAAVLADLERWCGAGSAVSIRLFHGPGGTGKTRLFLEWSKRRHQQGAIAGFLRKDCNREQLAVALAAPGDVLLVIDYAELRPDLSALLRIFAQAAGRSGRLRVALLARATGDWWRELMTSDAEMEVLLRSHQPTEIQSLAPTVAERRAIVAEAARRFAEALGRPQPHMNPELEHPRFERALYLHVAALLSVWGEAPAPDALLESVLDHEERFVVQHLHPQGSTVHAERKLRQQVRTALTALTLRGGAASEQALRELLQRLDEDGLPPDEERVIALHDLYGLFLAADREAMYAGGLEPDLLGEALVYRTLKQADRDAPRILSRVLSEASLSELRQSFVVLGRLSVSFADAARTWLRDLLTIDLSRHAVPALEAAMALGRETAEARVAEVLVEVLAERGTAVLARVLEKAGLPEHMVSLWKLGCWIYKAQLDALSHDEAQAAERARLLENLGNRQGVLGLRQEAVNSTQEAVQLYRGLAKQQTDAFLLALARSLKDLGIRQNELGQHKAALATAQESVKIYRGLAKQRPDVFLSDLARGLNNLALVQTTLGRLKEAEASAKEMVQYYRRLAEQQPDSYLYLLAAGMNNLGLTERAMGKHNEALSRMQEAVLLYRGLAKQQPDAFLKDLAMSLHNVGMVQSKLGRDREALVSTQEAVQHYRQLAERQPGAFRVSLGTSLHNLGLIHNQLGDGAAARRNLQEAVTLYQVLESETPKQFEQLLRKGQESLRQCAPPRVLPTPPKRTIEEMHKGSLTPRRNPQPDPEPGIPAPMRSPDKERSPDEEQFGISNPHRGSGISFPIGTSRTRDTDS